MTPYEPPRTPLFPPPPEPPRGRSWGSTLLTLVVAAVIALAGYAGYAIGQDRNSSSDATGQPSTAVSPRLPSAGNSTSGSVVDAIANRLDDSIVNITTTLSSGGTAAGTGIVLSSDGLVVTNNHVIADTVGLRVENAANGSVHRATVLGYDVSEDVALIKIQNVSGLTPAPIGDADSVSVGDPVVALGNAGGRGGEPSVVTGTVTGLDQRIVAGDQGGGRREQLSHLIRIDADIRPGDSGGPLANTAGKVIAIDTAASQTNGGFGFQGGATNEGYAIPIQRAMTVVQHIENGTAASGIHLGGTRGILGVRIQDERASIGDGAFVVGVASGSGADDAGIRSGDLITRVGRTTVSSASELSDALASSSPKDKVDLTWVDGSTGSTHHATITLQAGPPA